MFCPNCGTQIPDGSAFCQNCGAQVGVPQQPVQQQPQQPVYQQPQAQQQASYGQPQQSKKRPGILKIAIICVIIAVGIGVLKGVLSSIPDDGEPVEYRPNQRIESVEYKPSDSGSSSSGGSSSNTGEWNERWLLEGSAAGGTQSGGAGAQTAEQYSTDALPGIEDFNWYYDVQTGAVSSNMPTGATAITDRSLLSGGWKCLVVRKPLTTPRCEYWNLELTCNGSDVDCTQRWSGIYENGSWQDTSGANDNPLFGTIDELCVLELKDYYDSELTIIQWYTVNGKQYGVGTYQCGWDDEADGLGLAAVCRP